MCSMALPWSYSKLSLFKKCPYAFALRYIQKVPSVESPASARGSMIHQKLGLYIEGKNVDLLFGGSKTLPTAIHMDAMPFMEDLRKRFADHRDMVGIEYDIKTSAAWKVVEGEEPYWGRLIYDFVDMRGSLIVDFKTGKSYPSHEEQAKYYALGFYRLSKGILPRVLFATVS